MGVVNPLCQIVQARQAQPSLLNINLRVGMCCWVEGKDGVDYSRPMVSTTLNGKVNLRSRLCLQESHLVFLKIFPESVIVVLNLQKRIIESTAL
jgi:hypothetical protein